MLEVLLHPEAWQLVCSQAPPEVAPVRDARHLAWMGEHAHGHAHQEILLILGGEGYFGVLRSGVSMPSGHALLFDAFEPHDLECPAWSTEMEHLWIILVEEHFVGALLPIRQGGDTGPARGITCSRVKRAAWPGHEVCSPRPRKPADSPRTCSD